MDTTGSQDLLHYILAQASSGQRNLFGFQQQRVLGINLCYEIAKNHADTMTPDQITEYVIRLNNSIYTKLIKGD